MAEEKYETLHKMKEMVGGCCVCSDERGWSENPLVYCDGHGCNVAVHQGRHISVGLGSLGNQISMCQTYLNCFLSLPDFVASVFYQKFKVRFTITPS